jgi:hypothetical protein
MVIVGRGPAVSHSALLNFESASIEDRHNVGTGHLNECSFFAFSSRLGIRGKLRVG